jgi:hypothetical protein
MKQTRRNYCKKTAMACEMKIRPSFEVLDIIRRISVVRCSGPGIYSASNKNEYQIYCVLYFSILLHSFNTEYLFFVRQCNTFTSYDGRVRPKHVLIELKK